MSPADQSAVHPTNQPVKDDVPAALAATAHPNPGGERPVERIDELLTELRTYWLARPDLRLAQIIGNLSPIDANPYHVEDHFLLAELRRARP